MHYRWLGKKCIGIIDVLKGAEEGGPPLAQNCRYPSAEYIIPRTTDMYERLHHFLLMASLTREPSGADRSAISLYLTGLFYPNGLKYRFCMSSKDSTVFPSTSSAYCKKGGYFVSQNSIQELLL